MGAGDIGARDLEILALHQDIPRRSFQVKLSVKTASISLGSPVMALYESTAGDIHQFARQFAVGPVPLEQAIGGVLLDSLLDRLGQANLDVAAVDVLAALEPNTATLWTVSGNMLLVVYPWTGRPSNRKKHNRRGRRERRERQETEKTF